MIWRGITLEQTRGSLRGREHWHGSDPSGLHLQVCEVVGGWEATLDYAVLDGDVPVVELRVCDCSPEDEPTAEAAIRAVEARMRRAWRALCEGPL
jgi:hypothetical protein